MTILYNIVKWPGGGMVDARDLKSLPRMGVWVRVPPGLHTINKENYCYWNLEPVTQNVVVCEQ